MTPPNPRRTAAPVLAVLLCGGLLLSTPGTAAAAAPAQRPGAPASGQDIETLMRAVDELMASPLTQMGIVDDAKFAAIFRELDTSLSPDGMPQGASAQSGLAEPARLALKAEVSTLLQAAARGDWLGVTVSLQALPKRAQELLFVVGLGNWLPDPNS